MLAVFEKAVGKPPEELKLPSMGLENMKSRQEIGEIIRSFWPESMVYNLRNGNIMALSHENESPSQPSENQPLHCPFTTFADPNADLYRHVILVIWSTVVTDDIFCIFIGALENTSELRRHYGLSRQATEAMVVVEAYKVLRDRAPYPPDQVIKDLEGKFAFVLFDATSQTLFLARDREGCVELQWGMGGDGSLVCSNDPNIIREACGKSCAPFPPGCIFKNGSGLMSFDHPLHKVIALAIAREDDNGHICGVIFQVDLYTRLPSIPRTGSAANWADPTVVETD